MLRTRRAAPYDNSAQDIIVAPFAVYVCMLKVRRRAQRRAIRYAAAYCHDMDATLRLMPAVR